LVAEVVEPQVEPESERQAPILELLGISKVYPGVTALSNVSLSVAPGEILGLIGENGAGKSTLMKVLGGVVEPSVGSIRIGGQPYPSLTVPQAIAAGIAFVHQELNLFDNLDVAANVFIGREPVRYGPLRLIDRAELRRRVAPLLARFAVDFSADTPVSELSLAQRQLVEIVKALSLGARIVIMDEPTSSLTMSETARLMAVIADLRRHGVSVIFISHRLHEVEQCADRVVVLRDGSVVGELTGDAIRHDTMIRMMVGRDLQALYTPPQQGAGTEALLIGGLRTAAHPRKTVDLTLRHGEILGLAGLVGAGRTELARALFGIDRPLAGSLHLDGRGITIASPRDAIARGIYLIPEDRKRCGLILDDSVTANIALPDLWRQARYGLVAERRAAEIARQQCRSLRIKTPDVLTEVATLSGGNQQKVVLGKWLSMQPKVIIFDEPTRGIDVGAKSEIYDLMRALANAGVAILMISSDMEEVLGVSDRMAVMHEGRIAGMLDRSEFSEHNVMQLAVGRGLA
jgi:ribose transport system ATP-binding protein